MSEPTYSPDVPESSNDPQLSRRELLKSLAALGGAVAASSLLPEKWSRPQVGAGVLPAHAQSTLCAPPYVIDHCTISLFVNSGTELVTSAYILPPCPDIQMIVILYYIYDEESDSVNKAQSIPVVLTDSAGKATWSMTVIDFPEGASGLYAEWSFFNPTDGTDSCETNVVNILIGG